MREFDTSVSSQAVPAVATVYNLRHTGPEIRAFRAFDSVSQLTLSQSHGYTGGKSPAIAGKTPVLRRLLAETGSIMTAAPTSAPTAIENTEKSARLGSYEEILGNVAGGSNDTPPVLDIGID